MRDFANSKNVKQPTDKQKAEFGVSEDPFGEGLSFDRFTFGARH